jgi:hypothetical protein
MSLSGNQFDNKLANIFNNIVDKSKALTVIENSLPVRLKNDIITMCYYAYNLICGVYTSIGILDNMKYAYNSNDNSAFGNNNFHNYTVLTNSNINPNSNPKLYITREEYGSSLDKIKKEQIESYEYYKHFTGVHGFVYSNDPTVVEQFARLVSILLGEPDRLRPAGGIYVQTKVMQWTKSAQDEALSSIVKYKPYYQANGTDISSKLGGLSFKLILDILLNY